MTVPEFNGEYQSSRGQYTGSEDGEHTTLGAKTDAPVIDPAKSASAIGALKGLLKVLNLLNENGEVAELLLDNMDENLETVIATLGLKTDPAIVDPAQAASAISALKGLVSIFADGIELVGSGAEVASSNAAWLGSAAQYTVKLVDVAKPAILQSSGLYRITIINESLVSDVLTVVRDKETINQVDEYPELTRFAVPKATVAGHGAVSVVVQGWLLAAGNLLLQNEIALGAGDGFTARILIRRV